MSQSAIVTSAALTRRSMAKPHEKTDDTIFLLLEGN
jgi:hypothetical protein